MTYASGYIHSDRCGIPRTQIKTTDGGGGEDVNNAIIYLLADGIKRRSLVLACEHVTKCVAM